MMIWTWMLWSVQPRLPPKPFFNLAMANITDNSLTKFLHKGNIISNPKTAIRKPTNNIKFPPHQPKQCINVLAPPPQNLLRAHASLVLLRVGRGQPKRKIASWGRWTR
jgi:hypothetical protein